MQVRLIDPDSPNWPLPYDYYELTEEGQRLARVNATRQYLHPQLSLLERADMFVRCVEFFDVWYLHPDPESGFDPHFYDAPPLVTPSFHWDIVRAKAYRRKVIVTAPRGSGKSVNIIRQALVSMVTRPGHSVLYVTSTGDNAMRRGNWMRQSIYNNERIFNDFAPEKEFGGRIEPIPRKGLVGAELFQLSNNSTARFMGGESSIRGERVFEIILDDPEYDGKRTTNMATLRENMHQLVFAVLSPMVTRANTRIIWLNTFVSRRHYAWHAQQTRQVTLPDGRVEERAEDPDFDHFKRLIIRAVFEDEAGQLRSCWPHMWPLDGAQKKELGLDEDTMTMAELREQSGSTWDAEFMANPAAASAGHLGKPTEERHGYTLIAPDPESVTNPLASNARVRYHMRTPSGVREMVVPLRELILRSNTMMFCDTSDTAKATSDFKVNVCLALAPGNVLFVLDIWDGKTEIEQQATAAITAALRWRMRTIRPEMVRTGVGLCQLMMYKTQLLARTTDGAPSFVPVVAGFRPKYISKPDRIVAALQYRFEHDLIKLPFHRKHEAPFRRLFDQIEGFDPSAADCGLANDDHIDAVSMHADILRAPTRAMEEVKERPVLTPIQRIMNGETNDEDGTPLAKLVPFNEMPLEALYTLADSLKGRFNNAHASDTLA